MKAWIAILAQRPQNHGRSFETSGASYLVVATAEQGLIARNYFVLHLPTC